MKMIWRACGLLGGLILFGSAATAIETKPTITVDLAKKMAAGCEAKAPQEADALHAVKNQPGGPTEPCDVAAPQCEARLLAPPRAVPLCSLPAPRGTDRPRYAWPTWSRRSGSSRIGLPVALKTALATAGAIGGTPGSPTPVGASAEATMWTSTFGISLIRNGK